LTNFCTWFILALIGLLKPTQNHELSGGLSMNDVLEKEQMDILDLLQSEVASFEEDYRVKGLEVFGCSTNACSGNGCERACSWDCEASCGGTSA
jgi:hypothetical protein